MKAIRIHSYGSAEQLQAEEAPRPTLRAGEALVKIHAAGVNPIDWKIRAGAMKDFMPARFPLTMGQDIAGEILELAPDVREFKRGDPVFGFSPHGAYAELAAIPVQYLARKPASIDWVMAASLPTAGLTAWQSLIDVIRILPAQRILIHGAAGGVGSLAVQLARWKDARVIATASSRDHDYLRELGVETLIDYTTDRFDRLVTDLDAVLDLVGGETLARSYPVIRKGGILLTTVSDVDEDEAARRGIRAATFMMRRDARELMLLGRLVEQGIVKPRVAHVLPLSQARRAQELNEKGLSHGKVVLKVA